MPELIAEFRSLNFFLSVFLRIVSIYATNMHVYFQIYFQQPIFIKRFFYEFVPSLSIKYEINI